jgi:hypothetical protein
MSTQTETPQTAAPLPPHIEVMRQHLMDTLKDLRNREQPMDVDRARAVADTGADRSDFLEGKVTAPGLPAPSGTPTAHQPFPTTTVHKLRG